MSEEAVRSELQQATGKAPQVSVPLSGLTTIGCGGPAALVQEVATAEALSRTLEIAEQEDLPWFVLGLGSNLLVSDEGWDGLVIRLTGELTACSRQGDGMVCGGGASMAVAAQHALEEGLSGLETLAGIPGTIGGAISMNAGAYGSFIGDITGSVQVILPGDIRKLGADDLRFGYRFCELPAGAVVSQATLVLEPADATSISQQMESYRNRRDAAQPQGVRTFGSSFRNPVEGEGAGRLLDQAGCKGLSIGGAVVSEQHANFIINRGDASAGDVVELMNKCRRRVFEQTGVELEPEVRFLGTIGLEPL